MCRYKKDRTLGIIDLEIKIEFSLTSGYGGMEKKEIVYGWRLWLLVDKIRRTPTSLLLDINSNRKFFSP